MAAKSCRRLRGAEPASVCPICSVPFPSSRHFDPSAHDRMVVKHVMQCSAKNFKRENGMAGSNDDFPMCNDQPISSLRKRPQAKQTKKLCSEIRTDTGQTKGQSRVTKNSPVKGTVDRSLTKPAQAESASVRHSSGSSSLFQCLVCNKKISSAACNNNDFDEEVRTHVMKCSSASSKNAGESSEVGQRGKGQHVASACQYDERANQAQFVDGGTLQASTSENGDSVKGTVLPEEIVSSQFLSQESKAVSRVVSDSGKEETSLDDVSKARSGDESSASPVPLDPGHLLSRSWWRKPKRRKAAFCLTVPFDLQQCVDLSGREDVKSCEVKESSLTVVSRPNRESRRLRAISGSKDQLKLSCPVCRRPFTASWLVMTEDSMSRHVARCSKQYLGEVSTFPSQPKEKPGDLPELVHVENIAVLAALSRQSGASEDRYAKSLMQTTSRHEQRDAVVRAERASTIHCLLRGRHKRALAEMILGFGAESNVERQQN